MKTLSALIVANYTTGINPGSDEWPEPDEDFTGQRRGLDAYGIAVYFPEKSSSFSAEYLKLAFAQDSLWDEMVQDFFRKSVVATVLAEAKSGSLDTLREYVRTANRNNQEVTSTLIAMLNFHLYTETHQSGSFSGEMRRLLQNLFVNASRTPNDTW